MNRIKNWLKNWLDIKEPEINFDFSKVDIRKINLTDGDHIILSFPSYIHRDNLARLAESVIECWKPKLPQNSSVIFLQDDIEITVIKSE